MIRVLLFTAVVKLAALAAGPAPAQAGDLPRPAFSLAATAPEALERACVGAGGRLVPCRRVRPLR
jgi:hypothetical protein